MPPHENPPFPVPPEILAIAPTFDPDRYIDRDNSPLQDLVDWVTSSVQPVKLRLLSAAAHYGKSWQLARLAYEFWGDSGFFVAILPAARITEEADVKDWLDTLLTRLLQHRISLKEDSVDQRLAGLTNALNEQSKTLLLLIDGWDENQNPGQISNWLLDTLISQSENLKLKCIIIMAGRDNFPIDRGYIRRLKYDDTSFKPFSQANGIEQLQRIAPIPIPEEDLIALLEPYSLNVPGWNKCLYRKLLTHFASNDDYLLTAAEIDECWFSPLKPNMKILHIDRQETQIKHDILMLATSQYSEEPFAPQDFDKLCLGDANVTRNPSQRLDNLMKLKIVQQDSRDTPLSKLIDGLADLIRAELRLHNQIGGQPHD